MAIILIGGGAHSGKSRQALDLARKRGRRRMFLATAEALDPEMEARIARHRAERGSEFTTVEEPIEIADAIRKADADAIVVDCLTLWLSNVMLTFGRDIDAEIEELVKATRESAASIFLVTNEVGCGIVPESTLGRDFRDRSGVLNQRVGAAADEVYWMVFGHPLRVK
ncbi:MAG TPA: bifunctional adenosylcobinamide kinase/adenosylcobinamide-phosphate guanylyltransferase [Bryobacteraceae bacterium]|nr:bifunctional adenosylcobinamide kinase/adenosylcobinamide-phosphate guanylyltransferase [Bryobacteraceae bacterium]